MTKEWLLRTPNPPCIPVFYTLTKIRKPKPVSRQIISGCEGPTERISSFLDSLLQPVAKVQKSYLKDTMEIINFIERTKVPENILLISVDVTIKPLHQYTTGEMLGLILKENFLQFNGRNYVQTHGTAMGTKMAVAFANIFMSAVETAILNQSNTKTGNST